MSDSQKIGEAVGLALAHAAFQQAKVLLSMHTAAAELSVEGQVGVLAGVIVSYARPFGRNRGISAVAGLASFRGEPMAEDFERTHEQLLEARDKLYAHRDSSVPATGLETDAVTRILLEMRDGRVVRVTTPEPILSEMTLSWVPSLVEFQIVRCGRALRDAVKNLTPLGLGDGIYELTQRGMRTIP